MNIEQLLDLQVRQALEEIKRDIVSAKPIFLTMANDPKRKARAKLIEDLYRLGRNRTVLLQALQDLNK